MTESLYPKLRALESPKANGSHEDSFAGEAPGDGAKHQVKLLELEAVELRKNIASLLNERNAAQAEATEWRKRCNSGQLGWLAPYDADSLRRDVDRIREERDELRRQVDLLHTPEEMAEAVEAARNAGIEAAAQILDESIEPGDLATAHDAVLTGLYLRIRALKRSTSETKP